MRVGIDARFVTEKPRRGIGSYSLQIIRKMVNDFREIDYYLYIQKPDVEELLPSSDNVVVRCLNVPSYPIWENIALPIAVVADKVDVLHCLGNTAPFFLPRNVRLVVTLHDVMFLKSREKNLAGANLYQRLGRLYRKLVVPFCVKRASLILTVSEFSKQDILSNVSGISKDNVLVTYQSCNELFGSSEPSPLSVIDIRKPYILALGAQDPRKNTLGVVKAFAAAVKMFQLRENLVIVGYKNWIGSELQKAIIEEGLLERVQVLDYVSDQTLFNLYRNSVCFLYFSLYEGFGIPLLEAFSSGCPVIASNISSIPEVCGGSAYLINPFSREEMAEAIRTVCLDPFLRSSLVTKGRIRATSFTWSKAAELTVAGYLRVLKE